MPRRTGFTKLKRWSKLHATVAMMIALFSFTTIGIIGIAAFSGTPHPEDPAVVTVAPGTTPQEAVESLHTRGYGGNSALLKIALSIAGIFKKIEIGGYYITRTMSDWQLFRSLANPGLRYVKIAEGLRKEEVADFVAKRLEWNIIEKREFVNAHLDLGEENLEGKYFPDTYLIPVDADPAEVAEIMIENYGEKVEALREKYPKTVVNYDTALLVASIIQREAAGKQDMRLISGIIWNRIFKGMNLSLDATIQYARGKTNDGWWAPIHASDIRTIDSPYNTYKNDGLPPAPISNPGFAAFEAALNPQKTSCLYYLHDNYGRIHCSATGEGHERNINAYLK